MNAVLKGSFAVLALGIAVAAASQWQSRAADTGKPAPAAEPATAVEKQKLVRDGVSVVFEAKPLNGGPLTEGAFADVQFRITDSNSGQPLSGITPGAWLDQAKSGLSKADSDKECRTRTALYLKNSIGLRPVLDLNSYYLLVLNKDASLTVIDPTVLVGGTSSTMTSIRLKGVPMDWAGTSDSKRVFVSMPEVNQIAVVDTEKFQVVTTLDAGRNPVRMALQPDQRYLWVGNNASEEGKSGVTVIDTENLKVVGFLPSGAGHHEIAFSGDSRRAFVSNRDSGTLSVYEVATRKLLKTVKTGTHPLSVAYSPLSDAVYVADGNDGSISVIDTKSLELRKTIKSKAGLGPMRFSRDGRFAIVLNTLENRAEVIDAGSDEFIHSLDVAAEPYQLVFTRGYAFIRGLASPKVSMINLSSLGKGKKPIQQSFEAGSAAPRAAGNLPLADGLSVGRDDESVFVVNPVDNTTYYYAEGMNAPMSGYPNRGNAPRGARLVDHSLKEIQPGVYSARVKLPAAGRFDVAFILNQPQIVHCFATDVKVDPSLEQRLGAARIKFMLERPVVKVGTEVPVRFRIIQGRGDIPKTGVTDLRLRYFMAPSSRPQEVPVKEVGDGIYEASLTFAETGAYYLHVRSQSLGLGPKEQTFASLRVVPEQSVATGLVR
ncbi:PQQ-dependent catabolism-associated beta-propeller protein [compost metagenome]